MKSVRNSGSLCACTVFLLALAASCLAEQQPERTGLVLSGGGALGFFHVGVIKVLERERIKIDLVTGTSMGAIVGAAYAAGRNAAEMEQVLGETDWDRLFDEGVQRGAVPYRLKPGRDREILGSAKLGFREGKAVFPAGLVQGQWVYPLLQQLYATAPSPVDFDQLPVPFRAVATDLLTGEKVILQEGDLALAARMSMSVPGVFAPVEVDGRLLVDGGMVDNLPMDIARSMGATRLIVVAFPNPPQKIENLQMPLSVAMQSISLLIAQNSQQQLKTLMPQDALIAADLPGYSPADFSRARELVALGEKYAQQAVPGLRRFVVSEAEYAQYDRRRRLDEPAAFQLAFVEVENDSRVPDRTILNRFSLKRDDLFDADRAEQGIKEIYNLDEFVSVQYRIERRHEERGLVLTVREKAWQRDYLRLGFSLSDDFQTQSVYSLALAYRRAFASQLNQGYFEGQVEIGNQPQLLAELYLPWWDDAAFFFNPVVSVGRQHLLLRPGEEEIAEYDRDRLEGALAAGWAFGSLGEALLGLSRGTGRVERTVGDPVLPEFDFDTAEAFAALSLDTLDNPDFPASGFRFSGRYRRSYEALGASSAYDIWQSGGAYPIDLGSPGTLIIRAEAALTPGELAASQAFALGGFLDVSGYAPGTLLASDFVSGRLVLFREVLAIGQALFGLSLYGGASFELTSLRSDFEPLPDRGPIASGSLFVGTDTPLAPLYLGVGAAEEGERAVYLILGRLPDVRR